MTAASSVPGVGAGDGRDPPRQPGPHGAHRRDPGERDGHPHRRRGQRGPRRVRLGRRERRLPGPHLPVVARLGPRARFDRGRDRGVDLRRLLRRRDLHLRAGRERRAALRQHGLGPGRCDRPARQPEAHGAHRDRPRERRGASRAAPPGWSWTARPRTTATGAPRDWRSPGPASPARRRRRSSPRRHRGPSSTSPRPDPTSSSWS